MFKELTPIIFSCDIEYINNIFVLFLGALTCQSGCILGKLENALAEKGLTVPLDLGSRSSCQIGGNVSTNAGGMRLFKYGNLHGNVLGIEVVST